jgi:hypothetical protein
MHPIADNTAGLLKQLSFWVMVAALLSGATIVLTALIRGMREHRREAIA